MGEGEREREEKMLSVHRRKVPLLSSSTCVNVVQTSKLLDGGKKSMVRQSVESLCGWSIGSNELRM